MAVQPIFRATSGLNNVLEPHRLRYDEDGGCPLAEAVNVIIDNSGSIKRRYGIVEKVSGSCHSLWASGEYCFYVSKGNLYRYTESNPSILVFTGCGNALMYFELFGGKVYCSNGTFHAVIDAYVISDWVFSNPLQYHSDPRVLGIPSHFTILCQHLGRMFVVDGKFLWESFPHDPGCFQLGKDPMSFGSEIVGLVSVQDGLYVFTERDVRFLLGTCSDDFIVSRVVDFGAVPGTAKRIEGPSVLGGAVFRDSGVIWVSKVGGVYAGSGRGEVYRVTEKALAFDSAVSGAAAVLPGQYFFSLEVI